MPTLAAVFYDPSLDPFSVYRKTGEPQLRRRLAVLSGSQLANIAIKYRITTLGRPVLECLPAATLLELIVLGVTRGRSRRGRRRQRSVTSSKPVAAAPSSTTQSDR
jgi:hypothetical protein